MWKLHIVAVVVVFMLQYSSAVKYVFQAPSYTMVEVPGMDTEYTDVMISRTEEIPDEENMQRTLTLSTNCPSGVTATASTNDYSVSNPLNVEFQAGVFEMVVPLTILGLNDDEEEDNEFFCLTIDQDAGSQSYTRIIIPENDVCYEKLSSNANDYTLGNALVNYIGPWKTDISNVVEFDITPQGTGSGSDINIFLTEFADKDSNDATSYYQLILDDSMGTTHTAGDGDTLLFLGGTGGTLLNVLVPDDAVGGLLGDDTKYSFWLKYEESSGTISIGPSSDRSTPTATYSADAVAVKHIFVSSASGNPALFRVCRASPKKIAPVGASAIGYNLAGVPYRAIDGIKASISQPYNCFATGDMENNPWLQIDLGQVYEVQCVLISAVIDDAVFALAADIDNSEVRVGSCPPDNIEGNTVCYETQTGAMDEDILEGTCPVSTFGQYVYIYKPMDATRLALCEVEVYGTAVPYGSETTVQFTKEEYTVNENGGTIQLDTYRTIPSGTASCTSAEYYTDSEVTPASGDSNDFVAIPNDSSTEVSWDEAEMSGDTVSKPVTVTINDDNPGLCEASETFNVYLTNVVGGIPGEQSSARVTIIDDDSVSYSFARDIFTGREESGIPIEIMRTGVGTMQPGSAEVTFADDTATSADYDNTPITVNFVVSNSADAETTNVDIIDDERYEEPESFTVNLGTLTPNDGCSMYGTYQSATVVIYDNDSSFRFNVANGASIIIAEGESKTIEIVREGAVQKKYLDIVINEVTAGYEDDFTIFPSPINGVSTVEFVQNTEDETITINAKDDSELESSETFTLSLRDPRYPGGNRADPFSLTVTIVDKDAEYFWKQTSFSVPESGGYVNVCLIRTGKTDMKTVSITTTQLDAEPGTDFTPLNSIIFVQGQNEVCTDVQILDDAAVEGNEAFTLTISSGQDIIVGDQNIATVTLIDDDNIIGWSQGVYSFPESSENNNVVISKTGTASVSVTITITPDTATQNTDFNVNLGSSSTITIPNGASSYTLPVTILDDNDNEPNEVFTLSLSSASTGIISQAQTTITIVDDDMATVAPPTGGSGLGGGVIAAIIVSLVVGLTIIIIAIFVFCYMTSGSAGGVPKAGSVADPGVVLADYPPGGYDLNNAIGYGDMNVMNGYGVDGLSNVGFSGYNPYPYGRY